MTTLTKESKTVKLGLSEFIKFDDNCKLSSIFFAPNKEAIMPLVKHYTDRNIQPSPNAISIGNYDLYIHEMLNTIIGLHFNDYLNEAKFTSINTGSLIKYINECMFTLNQANYFKSKDSYIGQSDNKKYFGHIKETNCNLDKDNVFAVGRLLEDFENGDNDCYETAGGYRSFKALKGTVCYFCLDANNNIYCYFDSNCIVDHYNNNFYGNSTGNGTKNYKIGERVELRTKRFDEIQLPEILKTGFANIILADWDKGLEIAKSNIK